MLTGRTRDTLLLGSDCSRKLKKPVRYNNITPPFQTMTMETVYATSTPIALIRTEVTNVSAWRDSREMEKLAQVAIIFLQMTSAAFFQ